MTPEQDNPWSLAVGHHCVAEYRDLNGKPTQLSGTLLALEGNLILLRADTGTIVILPQNSLAALYTTEKVQP